MAKTTTKKDELADVIALNLNKIDKNKQIAFFLDQDTPTDINEFISTGSSKLDLAIANRPNGGVAVGRITELSGLEGSGKSLICAHMMADVQRKGGVAVLIDTETAVNQEFFAAVGVDTKKMVWSQVDTIEDIFAVVENIIETVRATDKKKLVLIVVDSIAGASTTNEMAADYSKEGFATSKALILGKAMRKITRLLGRERIALVFTNQLRQKMNAPAFSDPWTTPGGKAIPFHSSTRVRLSIAGKIQNKDADGDGVVGVKVKATIVKNRLGPPFRTAEFDVYFDRGIDDIGSWLDVMDTHKISTRAGAWYSFTDASGKEHRFQRSTFVQLLNENPKVRDEIYTKICDAVIMSYKTSTDMEISLAPVAEDVDE